MKKGKILLLLLLAAAAVVIATASSVIRRGFSAREFAGFGRDVQLWNPDTGQRQSLPAARPTSNLVLGPDGTSIVFGVADGTIEYWDIGTEQRLRSIGMRGCNLPTSGH